MLLSRTQFFLLLTIILVCPFYVSKLIWLNGSRKTTGRAWFMGGTLELNGSISRHLVILFVPGKDSVTFNAGDNLGFKVGDQVPVRYQQANPSDARVATPVSLWGDTWVDSLFPELFLLVLFITPNRFDPLVPWGAKIRIGINPFIKIIPKRSR
jgi:hypothetical protein